MPEGDATRSSLLMAATVAPGLLATAMRAGEVGDRSGAAPLARFFCWSPASAAGPP